MSLSRKRLSLFSLIVTSPVSNSLIFSGSAAASSHRRMASMISLSSEKTHGRPRWRQCSQPSADPESSGSWQDLKAASGLARSGCRRHKKSCMQEKLTTEDNALILPAMTLVDHGFQLFGWFRRLDDAPIADQRGLTRSPGTKRVRHGGWRGARSFGQVDRCG
jgi:hypothetical protein